MSLVVHYWDVQDSQSVSASKMNYIVSGGALNFTHSSRHQLKLQDNVIGIISVQNPAGL